MDPKHHGSELRHFLYTWRYLIGLLGIVVVVLLFYGEEDWRGYYSWQRYKERLAARGERVDPESFIPAPVPDAENFAMSPVLAPLFEFQPGTQQWRDPNALRAFQPLTSRFEAAAKLVKQPPISRANTWVRPATDLNDWAWAFAQEPNAKRREAPEAAVNPGNSRDSAAAVLKGLEGFSPALEQLRVDSQRPFSRFNLQYEAENPATILLPHLSRLKYFSQILQLRASAELALGKTDEAFADELLMIKVVNATRSEPIVISQLVRMAEMQMLLQPLAEGMGKWSEPQLHRLQEQLQKFDFLQDGWSALTAERVLFGGGVIEYIRRSPTKHLVGDVLGGSEGDSGAGVWSIAQVATFAPQGWFYLEELNHSRLFEKYLLPVIDLTNHVIRPSDVNRSQEELTAKLSGTPAARLIRHTLFASLLMPSMSRFSQKAAFAQAAANAAVLACALERFRILHGSFPNSLSDLVPQLLPELPHDVINGKPLTYELNPAGGYLLYSVGWNETDDGGKIKQNKSGVVDQNEGDWVWANNL